MPVPTQVSDLSTTIASNSPAGSDNVFPDLDNHIRALAGMLASVATNSATNGYSNPYLPNASAAVFNESGADIDFRAEGDTDANLLFLDASTDRVGVGTNTPDAKLTVNGVGAFGDGAVGAPSIANTGDLNTGIWFPAADTVAVSTGGVEAARLDASGNLGVGTTSPSSLRLTLEGNAGQLRLRNSTTRYRSDLAVNNAGTVEWNCFDDTGGVYMPMNLASSVITFQTGSGGTATERARITSGGDLLVGTTTASGAGGITLYNNGSTGFSFVNNNNASATGYVFSSYRRSSVEIGSITQNGTTAVLFNTTSDRRLKENIVPAPSASDVIDAIEIVSHDWKSAPDEHVTFGVIAQDLALVAPQAVLQGDAGEEIEKTWGVDYSKLVPMLIKEIQSLRARVAALEAL